MDASVEYSRREYVSKRTSPSTWRRSSCSRSFMAGLWGHRRELRNFAPAAARKPPRVPETAGLQWERHWHPACTERGAGGHGSMSETTDASQRPTILVVDDEPDVRALVREVLTLNGYNVIDTGDPFEARRIAER